MGEWAPSCILSLFVSSEETRLTAFHHKHLIFSLGLIIFHFLHILSSEILPYSITELGTCSGLLGRAIPTHYSGDFQE